MSDWAERLRAAGERWQVPYAPWLEGGRLSRRNVRLCAGLGLLSRCAYEGLGGGEGWAEAVGRAGAGVSLLTKVDDQVIDGRAFHGGGGAEVEAAARRYLAETQASLLGRQPAARTARSALAAAVGRWVGALADEDGWARWGATVRAGWAIQARAVGVFTRAPDAVARDEVEEVTGGICGLWLRILVEVGTLAEGGRPLTGAEVGALDTFGQWIQRADALADLERDQGDGLIATWVGWSVGQARAEYVARSAGEDVGWVYAAAAEEGVDQRCVPEGGVLEAAGEALGGLGEVASLLGWIRRYLLWRYVDHPLARVEPEALGLRVDDPARLGEGVLCLER